MNATLLNSIGLGLDLVGVFLLFFFTLPKKEQDALLLESAPSKEWREMNRGISKVLSYCGLCFVIIGFAVQIVSNHI